ncbi:MAG: DNA-binding response regulator, partial [Alphaproteobacteria bacterium HGW-Alphaproteobacteria-15]
MDVVNIFLTSELGESLEDFVHDHRRFTFDRLGPEGPRRLVEGPMWAFIDWVLPDLAGLELCRRLRADPRTADAHVTMVL